MIMHHDSSIKLGYCQDYAQSGAKTEVYIILYAAEVTNSVRKMSRICLGTAQKAKPINIQRLRHVVNLPFQHLLLRL